MPLTDRTIKTAKCENKSSVYLPDGKGLYLRVLRSGTKIWTYRYKNNTDKTIWFDFGRYPDMSLLDARSYALELKNKRLNGIDLVQERDDKKQQKVIQQAMDHMKLNVRELFERWLTLELCQRKDEGREIKRVFEKDVLPAIGDIEAEKVTRQMIAQLLDAILARGARRMTNRTLSELRQMFGFGYARGIIENDPTHRLKKEDFGGKEVERDRILSENEIALLPAKIARAGLLPSTQVAIWICLSTCCRIGELTNAKWTDIDLDAGKWIIPAQNSKNGKPHIVWLSALARTQFKKLQIFNGLNEWCYPDRSNTKAVCAKSITKQIGDRQTTSSLQGRSKLTDALSLPNGKWTPHDLRRTGATLMNAIGILPEIIERCLNHTEQNKVKRIYQRYGYEAEMKDAWLKLGLHIESVLPQPIT